MYDVVLSFVGERRESIIEDVVRYEIRDKYARFYDDQDNMAYIPLRNVTSIQIKPIRRYKEDQNDTESGNSTNS